MELSKKLKELRKQKGMSQEQLAEKLNVSRQAITKWETGLGIPDIENMKNIAILFHVSLDELLLEKSQIKHQEFLYESQTEYDIDYMKRCDMKLGSAYQIHVTGYQGKNKNHFGFFSNRNIR